jgi:hypothetical protein
VGVLGGVEFEFAAVARARVEVTERERAAEGGGKGRAREGLPRGFGRGLADEAGTEKAPEKTVHGGILPV